MDEQNSERFLICTIPSVRNVIEKNYRSDDCRSRSEYVSKAIKYYSGQLATKEKLCINSVVSKINRLSPPVSRFIKIMTTVHENAIKTEMGGLWTKFGGRKLYTIYRRNLC